MTKKTPAIHFEELNIPEPNVNFRGAAHNQYKQLQ
jgi:hypothetical protein